MKVLHEISKENTFFFVGLSARNPKTGSASIELSFSNFIRNSGINKIIRGYPPNSKIQENVFCELEMRACLKDGMLRAADYPRYENVFELNNKELIDIKNPYRLCTDLNTIKSMIIITEALEVKEFDESM